MAQDVALYVVATPIGNLNDLTLRALETLRAVEVIAAEDTRHSHQLLSHHGIQNRLVSLHEHNEEARLQSILDYLGQGQSVALISDAGTPLISDPGFLLVNAVRAQGYAVVPIPGPSALIAALSVAGLAVIPFTFYGFLPRTAKARQDFLTSVGQVSQTLVFYEASHRIVAALEDMQTVWGGARHVVLAKELTKLYETIQSGRIDEILSWLAADARRCKGEFVLLVEKIDKNSDALVLSVDEILQPLMAALPPKQATKLAAEITGLKKNDLYRRTMQWKQQDE